jgi:uncharacterized protein (TIGR03643 family)
LVFNLISFSEYTSMKLSTDDLSRLIEMAWEDRTPFEAIQAQFNLSESEVKDIMRAHLKSGSYAVWRERVSGRKTKHESLRVPGTLRAYCPTQYKLK